MDVGGWTVEQELPASKDVRRYLVRRDGRTGTMQLAASGSTAARDLATNIHGPTMIDRGVDSFGNPYIVVADHTPPTLPAPPAQAPPVIVRAARGRMSRQTRTTIATLVGLVVLAAAIVGVVKLAKPRAKTVRDYAVLSLHNGDAKVHCLHRSGLCESGHGMAESMDRTEVTYRSWTACVEAKACPLLTGDDDLPVTNLTFDQAQKYCNWRGGDLPTADDWEAAARGRDARPYPWGDGKPTCELANLDGCGGKPTAATREPGASEIGIEDLVGNVAEFVRNDGFRRDDADSKRWHVRGGSYRDVAHPAPLLDRVVTEPAPDVGFRCIYDYRHAELASDSSEAIARRMQDRPASSPAWGKVAVVAKPASPKAHDFTPDLETKLKESGAEISATADATVTFACTEKASGSYTYSYGGGPGFGPGEPGTEMTCVATIAGRAGTIELPLVGSTSSGTRTTLYESAVEGVRQARMWSVIPVAAAVAGGHVEAAPELARVCFTTMRDFGEPIYSCPSLALAHRDVLEPSVLAMALVASNHVVDATQLGDAAEQALDGWARTQPMYGKPDLELGRSLIAAGPRGEHAIAKLLSRLPDDTQRYGDARADQTVPWLELLGERASSAELIAVAKRWQSSVSPSIATAARDAITKMSARTGGNR